MLIHGKSMPIILSVMNCHMKVFNLLLKLSFSQQQVAIFYHTLLGDKKHLLLLDVYFYQQECVIMFDEGKVYEETIAYDKDNDTKDFYYQISIKINDYLKQYLIDQANSKS